MRTALDWLGQHSIEMANLDDRAAAARHLTRVLDRLGRTRDGSPAAATTARRKRMVLHNALAYAVNPGTLAANPLNHLTWRPPICAIEVNPRRVIDPDQGRRFLSAVAEQGDLARRLQASFFAVMYYAALRPAEAMALCGRDIVQLPCPPSAWGELLLTGSERRPGRDWIDIRGAAERGPLKHRPPGAIRQVPLHPDLVETLRDHLARYVDDRPASRMFTSASGAPVTEHLYLPVFHAARAAALTPAQRDSGLMPVPDSLRHAAVSTWLRATGDPALVARWAGHSVNVLLRTYTHCLHDTDANALTRIWTATRT